MYPRGNPSTSNAWRSLVSTTASTTPNNKLFSNFAQFSFFLLKLLKNNLIRFKKKNKNGGNFESVEMFDERHEVPTRVDDSF
jgi:hypothetical protein